MPAMPSVCSRMCPYWRLRFFHLRRLGNKEANQQMEQAWLITSRCRRRSKAIAIAGVVKAGVDHCRDSGCGSATAWTSSRLIREEGHQTNGSPLFSNKAYQP